MFAILALEKLREDRSSEAGIIEFDGEKGTIFVAGLDPAGTDLGFAGIDAVGGRHVRWS